MYTALVAFAAVCCVSCCWQACTLHQQHNIGLVAICSCAIFQCRQYRQCRRRLQTNVRFWRHFHLQLIALVTYTSDCHDYEKPAYCQMLRLATYAVAAMQIQFRGMVLYDCGATYNPKHPESNPACTRVTDVKDTLRLQV